MTSNIELSLQYRRLLTYFRNQPLSAGRANQFIF